MSVGNDLYNKEHKSHYLHVYFLMEGGDKYVYSILYLGLLLAP